jgi:integration host factor subunit alpha
MMVALFFGVQKDLHVKMVPYHDRLLSIITNPLTPNEIFANVDLISPAISTTIRTERDPLALTKKDIVDQVQEQLGFPTNQSVDITEALLELIKSSLEAGEDVLVSGFGKFCVKEKAERKGRNPATGEDAILPARRVITFKCSGQLRDRVNGG